MKTHQEQKKYCINDEEAFERVLKIRGYERRPDGLYKNNEKVDWSKIGAPKITGEDAARLIQEIRRRDAAQARAQSRSRYKIIR